MLADVKQSGPFGILDYLRLKAGLKYDAYSNPLIMPGSFIDGLTCVYCNSIWIGLAFTILLLVSPTIAFYVSLPFALSAVAIFVNKLVSTS